MFPGAHEPTVARAPTGEYVMMFTSAPWGPNGQPPVNATHFKPCDCTSLDTTKQCGWSDLTDGVPGVTPPPIGYLSRGMPTFMSYAKTPAGPWSPPMSIPIRGLGDANFAFSKNTTLQSTRNPPVVCGLQREFERLLDIDYSPPLQSPTESSRWRACFCQSLG